jgi:cyclopropane fatty-acyl-phospholipid synthase-like methyltransferase
MKISRQYVDGSYYEKHDTFWVKRSPWKAQQVLRMAAMHGLRPNKVVDVGCGAGEVLVQLSKRWEKSQLFGYELSPQAFELCRLRASERISYFNEDFFERVQQNFDLVLCLDVIEHVEDYFSFLRMLVSRGQHFIFHIPLDMNVKNVLLNVPFLRRDISGHLHYFSKDTALAALKESGYSTVSWFYTPGALYKPKRFNVGQPNSWGNALLNLPRRFFFFLSPEYATRILGGYSLLVYAKPNPA